MAAASPVSSQLTGCIALSPEDKLLVVESPSDYPCFKQDGFYRPTSACRKRCCVVPPTTPAGEDSPKWLATQPTFDEDEENILAFSPSQCSQEEQAFYGRRGLRKMHGQDPVVHRHLFTPPKRPLPALQWPSWEEAERDVKKVRMTLGGY